jgi:outer membrane receptor protein involved in Fe transport
MPATTFNAGKTVHQGLEAGLDWQATPSLRLRQTYAWSDFRFKDDVQYADGRLPVVPEHLYRAELRYRLSGYHAKAESSGRSASPTVAAGYLEAKEAVDATPCDLRLARFYVEQYQFLTRDLPPASSPRQGQEGRYTS